MTQEERPVIPPQGGVPPGAVVSPQAGVPPRTVLPPQGVVPPGAVVSPQALPPQVDLGGRVEVLRGWVAALDRIIGIRTRVFLVLTAIAIGASGAAIYLALDAESDKASKDDVRALRQEVEAGPASAGSTGSVQTRLQAAEDQASAAQASVDSLRAEVDALRAQLGAQTPGVGAGAAGATGPGGPTAPSGASGKGGPAASGSDRRAAGVSGTD